MKKHGRGGERAGGRQNRFATAQVEKVSEMIVLR